MRKTLSFVVAFATVLVIAGCQEESGIPIGVAEGPGDLVQVDVDGAPIKIVPPSGAAARSLALASLTGIQIAYDLSHDTGRQSTTSPTGSNLNSIIFGDLTAAGATITVINAFTPAVLSGFDVLWLEEDFNTPLSAAEKTTLANFVAAGGAVLMCCEEWAVFSADHGSPLGVFGFGYTPFGKSGISTNINPHPTTAGVASVDFQGSGWSLTLPGTATALVLDPGGTQTEVAIDGPGRVVVLSDELCLDAEIVNADNRLLCNQLVDFIARRKRGRVVESVTGSGSFTADGLLRTFAFSANKHADGTVTGEWQQNNRAAEVKAHGDVTCFTIVDNAAWIGGVAERTDADPGEVAWRVVDNGEGKKAAPDEISLKFDGAGPGFAADYCNTTPANPPLNDVEAGNIQIKQ